MGLEETINMTDDNVKVFSEIDYAIEALDMARTLLIDKGKDYNSGDVKVDDYYLFGERSCIHEIWKKVLRLRSLLSKTTSDIPFNFNCSRKPIFESKEDTLIDLINYAAIYYSYLKRHQDDR